MSLRSFLFVPGDSERKLEKARQIEADALILDLEDGVAAENLAEARLRVARFLTEHTDRSRRQLWVRIGDLGSGQALDDLAAVVQAAPDGIVLPKSTSGADVATLDRYLSALEVRDGVERGSTRILPIATETAQSVFHLESYRGCSERLFLPECNPARSQQPENQGNRQQMQEQNDRIDFDRIDGSLR